MLVYLHVKNIAIIDEIEIDFSKGFSVLSGETGAGKSIIIGSINAVLGSRINKDFVRKGADFAFIEAVFVTKSKRATDILEGLGIESFDELVISRKISSNGRSVFRINGQIVNRENVRELADFLIDIHSQLENQSLLDKKNHINLLDKYVSSEINDKLDDLAKIYREYIGLKKGLNENISDPEFRKRQISFLEFEISEIENARIEKDEDIRLKEKYSKLSNMSKIREVIAYIDGALNYGDHSSSVTSLISGFMSQLSSVKKYDENLQQLYLQVEQIDLLLNDFTRELYSYSEGLVFDDREFDETRQRFDLINKLKSKYGDTIDDILLFLTQKKEEYNQLIEYEENIIKINGEIEALEAKIINKSKELTKIRKNAAIILEKLIKTSLKDLNLPNIEFKIHIEPKNEFNQYGMDAVEFMIATNKGESLKPLNKIASGGELSRIMLAIKSILADHDDIDTMIFDEIDTGISGRTAQKVAEKMYHLSKNKQLICITHLPQIASMSDFHYVISKEDNDQRSTVEVNQLTEEMIPRELSRLLSGAKITASVMESAREMKKLANQYKETL